ncbi:MAG: tRNA/rRNA methyltransferase [Rhodocyclales bacterium]|nr:tRNA/rRNA methyltransferase [Rhodocyclales bacterium]
MKQIASRDNPTFKHLRALADDARYRRSENATLLDGIHLLQAAVAAGIAFKRVAVTANAMERQEIADAVSMLASSGCELIELPEPLLRALSPVETPSGIVAEMQVPALQTADQAGDMLLLEAVQDAGNLGTLLRTAAAAGIKRVLLSEQCAQAWSPKVLRAGMGAHFALQIAEQCALSEALDTWSGAIVATSLAAEARDIFSLDLRQPVAWMFGSEGSGLSTTLCDRATALARIPMPGGTESLNVAAAAAVCLFEQVRQRLKG